MFGPGHLSSTVRSLVLLYAPNLLRDLSPVCAQLALIHNYSPVSNHGLAPPTPLPSGGCGGYAAMRQRRWEPLERLERERGERKKKIYSHVPRHAAARSSTSRGTLLRGALRWPWGFGGRLDRPPPGGGSSFIWESGRVPRPLLLPLGRTDAGSGLWQAVAALGTSRALLLPLGGRTQAPASVGRWQLPRSRLDESHPTSTQGRGSKGRHSTEALTVADWGTPFVCAARTLRHREATRRRGLSDSMSLLPPGFRHQCNNVQGRKEAGTGRHLNSFNINNNSRRPLTDDRRRNNLNTNININVKHVRARSSLFDGPVAQRSLHNLSNIYIYIWDWSRLAEAHPMRRIQVRNEVKRKSRLV
ncbi:uncharacterized protein LOC130431186 [Triplophysa dalaica]|uniref:uncharacterized protein LOC130431186 n=1 Tax=Triplophysa dalaica TaxID=1582913 RepID=UPI0024DFCCB3|nr:uncharacterized protein LOC130431186 [Triplophysa dalaica]XP_056616033.1 uncharacterized protein LOC130431186 [Triplophysa dalaica]